VQIKFKDWSLNQPLIAPNGYENPASTANKACLALALGKKLLLSLSLSYFSFFSFFSQKAEGRTSIRIKPCDILAP
jgi:hypothetical protein